MNILKIVFLALLCLPLLYAAIALLGKLISEIQIKDGEAAEQNRVRMRNVIDSDRSRYSQNYYRSRVGQEISKRGPRSSAKKTKAKTGRAR